MKPNESETKPHFPYLKHLQAIDPSFVTIEDKSNLWRIEMNV